MVVGVVPAVNAMMSLLITGHRPTAPPRKWRSEAKQVRHVPILVETEDTVGHTRLLTGGSYNVPINYSWSVTYSDR